ncbi:MAG: FHA domain-containing protein [Pseudomonadota bacterium]
MFKVKITNRSNKESVEVKLTDAENFIGRLTSCRIPLPSKGVSRQHAKVLIEGENAYIIDLGSVNGTFLNGNKLQTNQQTLLQNADLISIETFDILFRVSSVDEEFAEEVTNSEVLEVKLLKKVLGALEQEKVPSLEVLNGAAEGKRLEFTDGKSEYAIGRDDDCDLSIKEHVISRRHATINMRWGGIAIRDLESKNGTFLNSRRIVEEFLHDGDRIALGTIVMIFRNPKDINLSTLPESVAPKNAPARIDPDKIPLGEPSEKEIPSGEEEEEEKTPMGEKIPPPDVKIKAKSEYPAPKAKESKYTTIEIGLMALGFLVLTFATITIVNLLFS